MARGLAGLLFAIIAVLPLASWAQKSAITEDGERVILNDDGTWGAVAMSMADDVAGIRGVVWGMSLDEVKGVEDRVPKDDYPELLTYRVWLSGLPTVLSYSFEDDQLTAACYAIQDAYTNKRDYITDFDKLRSLVGKKYGAPSRDDQIWRNVQFKSNPLQWGAAVQLGHLSYVAEWHTNSKSIRVTLGWVNDALDFAVRYTNPKFVAAGGSTPEQRTLMGL